MAFCIFQEEDLHELLKHKRAEINERMMTQDGDRSTQNT